MVTRHEGETYEKKLRRQSDTAPREHTAPRVVYWRLKRHMVVTWSHWVSVNYSLLFFFVNHHGLEHLKMR